MLRIILLLIAALAPAPDPPACMFGGESFTTFSIALSRPSYTLWTTAPASYELQAPNADLQAGVLPARTPLAIKSDATVGLFVRMDQPATLYLCPDGARPSFVYLPMIRPGSSDTAPPSSP